MTKILAATLTALTIAALSPRPSAGADAAWDGCKAQPTRACVLGLAARDVAALDDPYEKAFALGDLGEARLKAGLTQDADQDFAQAEQAADKSNGDVMRAGALDGLAITLARAGEIDAATRVEGRVDASYPDQGWAAIAVAAGKAGRPAQAEAMVAQAFERARSLKNDYLTFGALRAVAEAQRALGLAGAAAETERLALKAALTGPDPNRHDYDLGRLAAVQATAGDFEAALRTAGLIEEPWPRASAVIDVERAEAAAGKFDDAARIAGAVDAPFRLRALTLLAWEQFKAGAADKAAETLTSARAIVSATADTSERNRGLAQIAALEAERGDAKAADADFAPARAALAGLTGSARADLARTLAYDLADAERPKEALALIPEIDAGAERDGALIAASEAQRRAGDHAAALATLEQVADRSLRVRLLEALAGALPR
jgi:hypothetical protein